MSAIRMPRFDRTTALVAAVLLCLTAAYALAVYLARDYYVVSAPPSSTFSSSPEGLKVYYRYLEELGLHPATLQTFEELPSDATLLSVGPYTRGVTGEEAARTERWVRGGGRLVIVGIEARELLGDLPMGASRSQATGVLELKPLFPSMYADRVSRLRAGRGRLLADSTGWVTHYKDLFGQVLISQAVGNGEVVWLADAYPLSNEGIGLRDDARFATLLAAAGEGRIYFDEYHHGYSSGGGVWDRLGNGGRAALALAALAGLIVLSASGRRLGPPIDEPEVRTARTGGYIGLLAELYRKVGAGSEALEAIEDGLVRALVRRYGSLEVGLRTHPRAVEALESSRQTRASGAVGHDELLAAAGRLREARQEVEG